MGLVKCSMLCAFRTLNDNKLIDVGILDSNHRRAILNKINPGVDQDFNNMLGDLSSVIKDLECFSVVGLFVLAFLCMCVFEPLPFL